VKMLAKGRLLVYTCVVKGRVDFW